MRISVDVVGAAVAAAATVAAVVGICIQKVRSVKGKQNHTDVITHQHRIQFFLSVKFFFTVDKSITWLRAHTHTQATLQAQLFTLAFFVFISFHFISF